MRDTVLQNYIGLHNLGAIDEIAAVPYRDDNGSASFRAICCAVHETRKIEHLVCDNMAG